MPDPANSSVPLETYDIRRDDVGWTVYNVRTAETARVNCVPQTGLDMEKADDLADLLNYLAWQKSESVSH